VNKTHLSPLVRFNNVSIKINQKILLKNICLEIFPKEIISIIGYNGAGKTTLIKTILGLYTPYQGKLNVNTKKIGYVPQKLTFDQSIPLSVLEFFKIYSNTTTKIIQEKLAEVSVPHVENQKIGSLSGGELQKVLIANALLQNPELLLLDEATAGIDIAGEKQFYELITKIHQKYKLAILMVSHDIHTVFAQSTKVLCLHQTICCQGSPENVSKDPSFKKLFGSYVAPYEHHHPHQHCPRI